MRDRYGGQEDYRCVEINEEEKEGCSSSLPGGHRVSQRNNNEENRAMIFIYRSIDRSAAFKFYLVVVLHVHHLSPPATVLNYYCHYCIVNANAVD